MRYAIIDQPAPGATPANVLSVVETDGDPPPVQAGQSSLCDPPGKVAKGWTLDNGAFAPPPTLATLQAAQISALTASCAAEIVGGYPSSALGAVHTYPSKSTDQINMLGSVTASLLPGLPAGWTTPFWCADDKGVWSFQAHTAAQIQQAGADGKTAVATAQTKLAILSAQVMAATSAEDVAAVVW